MLSLDTKNTEKKLKNKKTLYIQIRAYKRINRKNKYSTWSEIKKVIVNQ